MKYLIQCHAEGGATIPYPLKRITFVLDSLHLNTPPAVPLAEDILIALGSVPHGIFSLFGGEMSGQVSTPIVHDLVLGLPEEVPADIVVRAGQIICVDMSTES